MTLKQYFIGVNRRDEEIILGLFDHGATLMFTYYPVTIELNRRFDFRDGEWMLITCTYDTELRIIQEFLDSKMEKIDGLKYMIVPYQTLRK